MGERSTWKRAIGSARPSASVAALEEMASEVLVPAVPALVTLSAARAEAAS